MVFLYIGIAVLFICYIVGLFITLMIIKPKRRSLLDTSILEEEKFPGLMKFYQENLTETYIVKSKYGYNLQAYFFKNKVESNKYMVMAHGHTYTHHGCLKYARMMMAYGYNVVLFDERYHGNSGGRFTSLGYYEKVDLNTVITDTFNRYGDDIFVGTYGESMGAATVLLEAQTDKRINFIIADCGFSDFSILLKELMRTRYKIPLFPFYFFTKLNFRIFTGVSISGISPITAIKSLGIPIMFAHGLADEFISYKHSQRMYDAYTGPKRIFLANNDAYHAGSYHKDQENYEENIREFLNIYVNEK